MFVRSENGAICGVCKGLAQKLDVPVGLVRLGFVLSVICFGFGLGVYILLALALPRGDKLQKALEPKVLGVCAFYSKKLDIEVGLVRLLALILLVGFSLLTFIGYFVVYLMIPEDQRPRDEGKSSVSRNSPSVPPSTV